MAGLSVAVGFGRTPLLSSYAAEHAMAGLAVLEDERAFLSALPLAAASPSPPQAEILARWGLRTCGELTALPKGEIGARLGAGGVALWERAAGETVRVLRPVEPAKTFAAQ
jgi:protein ImuB